MRDWFKIVESDGKGNIKTLFHGVDGSRMLRFGEWLQSEYKLVKDGSSVNQYMSGWHIMPSLEECVDYLKIFKHRDNKKVVRCKAKEIWPKTQSRKNVFLADSIKIEEIVWG